MTNLGALNERLQSRLQQDKEMMENCAKLELESLSASLNALSQNALSTMENAISQQSKSMLTAIENNGKSLNRAFLRVWLRNLLIGTGIVIGLALGTAGLFAMMSSKLYSLHTDITGLENRKRELERTLTALDSKAWGLTLLESKEGRFIILPPSGNLKPGWTIGKNPAWKLE